MAARTAVPGPSGCRIDRLRQKKVSSGRLLVIVAAKVQVHGAAELRSYAEVEGDCALQNPPVRRHGHEPGQQAVEGHQRGHTAATRGGALPVLLGCGKAPLDRLDHRVRISPYELRR